MVISDRLIVSHAASPLVASTESPQRFHLKRALFLLYIKKRFLELGAGIWRLSLLPQRYFCTASTSLSPLPLENTGLSMVPPILERAQVDPQLRGLDAALRAFASVYSGGKPVRKHMS